MQEITLKLTIPEVNQILDSLGRLPYAEVYELIGKLQRQAQQQIGLSAVPAEGSEPAEGSA
jgi:hypothetical protein